jgi:hypothetical protein
MMFAAGLVAARFLKASDRGGASSRPLNIESKGSPSESLAQTSTVAPGREKTL